jgi:hypothetical protein
MVATGFIVHAVVRALPLVGTHRWAKTPGAEYDPNRIMFSGLRFMRYEVVSNDVDRPLWAVTFSSF